jgi:nucleoporin p58/p45
LPASENSGAAPPTDSVDGAAFFVAEAVVFVGFVADSLAAFVTDFFTGAFFAGAFFAAFFAGAFVAVFFAGAFFAAFFAGAFVAVFFAGAFVAAFFAGAFVAVFFVAMLILRVVDVVGADVVGDGAFDAGAPAFGAARARYRAPGLPSSSSSI